MTERIKETEAAALSAAKDKLDSLLAPLSSEEREALLLFLLEVTK